MRPQERDFLAPPHPQEPYAGGRAARGSTRPCTFSPKILGPIAHSAPGTHGHFISDLRTLSYSGSHQVYSSSWMCFVTLRGPLHVLAFLMAVIVIEETARRVCWVLVTCHACA